MLSDEKMKMLKNMFANAGEVTIISLNYSDTANQWVWLCVFLFIAARINILVYW